MLAVEIRRKRLQHMRAYINCLWHLEEVYEKINGEMRYCSPSAPLRQFRASA
jgi:hypothetical protein